ncbi:MAG: DUF3127 domain-containing protein [Ignavibacteria bacterium]|nr:DUF3127 domain-containing protein [Ignavibacteria bacterium]
MANSFETNGSIIVIMDTQQITDTFKKREFVVEIADGNYPQQVKFQMIQDKTALLDNYKVGQQVKIFFNLKGRSYTRKDNTTDYFTNLDCWRIESAEGTASASNTDYSQIQPASASAKDDFDDVPF